VFKFEKHKCYSSTGIHFVIPDIRPMTSGRMLLRIAMKIDWRLTSFDGKTHRKRVRSKSPPYKNKLGIWSILKKSTFNF